MLESPRNGSIARSGSVTRIRIWYAVLILIFGAIVVRLFHLQIIRHNYYKTTALQGQLKEYDIPAQRGVIEAHNGDQLIPIVLNEMRYTLFADPKFIEDPAGSAAAVADLIGGSSDDYREAIERGGRYAVLAKKLTKEQKQQIDRAAEEEAKSMRGQSDAVYKWKGIGTREVPYRTYPQGELAAQLLGFVDDEGVGKYGIEQALNDDLKGSTGTLKAITDASGVPLAANSENTLVEPQNGDRVILTVDIGLQQMIEDSLKANLERAQSESGSVLVLDARDGTVKAMANYPTYNPAEFFKVEDGARFANPVVSAPLEIGSIMKPLTVAAGIDAGVISKDSTYADPGSYTVDGAVINNIEEGRGRGIRSMEEMLRQSLNTGPVWILMQMGGGEINAQARERWHGYMTDNFRFGRPSGIEQGYEEAGYVPDPNEGYGLNLQYANTSFGQGMSANLLQVASAFAATLNGGQYFQPRLVEKVINSDGDAHVIEPKVVRQGAIKPAAGQAVREIMEHIIQRNWRLYGMAQPPAEYSVGGKTGTAQVARPEGGYYEDRFNGTFAGFVGGNDVEYIIVVTVNEPGISGYAGARAAGPLFGDVVKILLENYGVTPKN